MVAYESLKTKEKSGWGIPKIVADVYGIIVVVSAFINHCVVIKVNRLMTNKTNEQTGKNLAKHHAVNLILLAYNSLKRITFHKRKTSPLFLEDFKEA